MPSWPPCTSQARSVRSQTGQQYKRATDQSQQNRCNPLNAPTGLPKPIPKSYRRREWPCVPWTRCACAMQHAAKRAFANNDRRQRPPVPHPGGLAWASTSSSYRKSVAWPRAARCQSPTALADFNNLAGAASMQPACRQPAASAAGCGAFPLLKRLGFVAGLH